MTLSEELLLDENHFRQQVSHYLPDIQLDSVYKFTEQDLKSYLHSLGIQALAPLAMSELQHAVKKRDHLDDKRKKRHLILRGPRKAQILATSIVEFLDSFSTISEIIKAIDPQAGGIAYGTLYVLLKTGYNKQRHEDFVTGALNEFRVSLPQLNIYQSAHINLQRMSSYIREVYKGIVIFAREASIFYARSGAGRWWKAGVSKISSIEVENQIGSVRSAIKHVVEEANAVMSKRMETVTKNMTLMSKEMETVAKEMTYVHNDSLATLRQTLSITDTAASSIKMIEACSDIYTPELFASISRRGRTIFLEEANIALLSTAGLLDLFQLPTKSSFLLLSGTNHDSFNKCDDLCWLSPLALDIGRKATGPLAFYSTQFTGPENSNTQRDTISKLLVILIYQLLTWEGKFAREWRHVVDRATNTEAWHTGTLKTQKKLLLELLNALADRNNGNSCDQKYDIAPITLIIDRPDAFCELAKDGGRDWPISDALYELVEVLLEVLNDARGIVKVVMIMHSSFSGENNWNMKWLWENLEKKYKPPILVCRRNWDQGKRE